MTKQLYEEALADVKKLKEVAEDNAKRALLEAVTPRIKDLIENQLLGEAERDEDGELLLDDMPEEMSVSDEIETMPMVPVGAPGDSDLAADAISMPDEEGKVTLDLDALKTGDEDVYELSMESAKNLGLLVKESNSKFDQRLKSIARQLNALTGANQVIRESGDFKNMVFALVEEVEAMYVKVQKNEGSSKRKSVYESILENYYSTLNQLTEQKMKRNIKTLSEADVTLKLTGLPDEVDLDSVGVDLITGEGGDEEEGGDEDLDLGDEEGGEEEGGEEEGGDEDLDLGDEEEGGEEEEEEATQAESFRRRSDNLVVEIDEGMLRREIARMKSLREESVPSTKGFGPGDVSDDFAEDEMDVFDVDLTTESDDDSKTSEADMHEYGMDEADDMKEMDESEVVEIVEDDDAKTSETDMHEYGVEEAEDERDSGGNVAAKSTGPGAATNKQSRQPGATVESLRRRLAAELKLQTEAKKRAKQAKGQQNEMQKMAAQNKQIAAKAQQKGQKTQAKKHGQAAQKAQAKANQLKEAYAFYATKFNESVRRTQKLKGMLNEAVRQGSVLNGASQRSADETSNLRNKLAETNLFNTKLLYANKVLQNESFTKSQKAEIIERLDEARSDREVKLVFESLVRTLNSASRRKMDESVSRNVMGSSSRPTRPASTQTLNEGFETDRWARLAGIVK